MPYGNAHNRSPIRVGAWRDTGKQIVPSEGVAGRELWEAEPDDGHPFWARSDKNSRRCREAIEEALRPAGGRAVMKLVGRLDFRDVTYSRVRKTNRELKFAESQRIDHASQDPPAHLVATLAVEDLLVGEDPTEDTIAERVRAMSVEETNRFLDHRAGIVMVKYAAMGCTGYFNSNRFFDWLAARLTNEDPSPHRVNDEVKAAVDHWLSDQRYLDTAQLVPRAVLAESLLQIARQVFLGFDEATNRFREDRPKTYHEFLHRDVKPDNLFVDHKGHVRLGDFGHAIEANDSGQTSEEKIGSLPYAPPEALRGELYLSSDDRDSREDVWALGMTLAALWRTVLTAPEDSQSVSPYTYNLPFAPSSVTNETERAKAVVSHERHVELFTTMPKPLAAVIAAMLITDRKRRLSRKQAAELVEAVLSDAGGDHDASFLDHADISGAQFAKLDSADQVVATAVATATTTAYGRVNVEEQLQGAAHARKQLGSLRRQRCQRKGPTV